MTLALRLKLARFAALSPRDERDLSDWEALGRRRVSPRGLLVREGERQTHVKLLLSGWSIRFKTLPNGRRQITAVLLPADLCDLHCFLLRAMDHSIAALTAVEYLEFSKEAVDALAARQPRLMNALVWDSLVHAAIQREWAVNLGQRTALQRMAHLICELYCRLWSIGQTDALKLHMPLTQVELADALGISAVHANRIVQGLRRQGVLTWQGEDIEITDWEALAAIGLFTADYMHMAGPPFGKASHPA